MEQEIKNKPEENEEGIAENFMAWFERQNRLTKIGIILLLFNIGLIFLFSIWFSSLSEVAIIFGVFFWIINIPIFLISIILIFEGLYKK